MSDLAREIAEMLEREGWLRSAAVICTPKRGAAKSIARYIAPLEARIAELEGACRSALSYLPARDGLRTGEPDGDAQLLVCNRLKSALAGSGDMVAVGREQLREIQYQPDGPCEDMLCMGCFALKGEQCARAIGDDGEAS